MKAARALALTPCPSQLDGLIHRFITLLADTSDSRASESRVADASMACRKLAVAHPLLLLRYCLSVQPGVSPPPARRSVTLAQVSFDHRPFSDCNGRLTTCLPQYKSQNRRSLEYLNPCWGRWLVMIY